MGVDRIVQGPPSTTGTVNYDSAGVLIADAANNALYLVGNDRTANLMETVVALLVNQTPLTAITTAQTLFSVPFNAGALNVLGRTLRIRGTIVFNTTAAADATVTLVLTLGGVTLGTIVTTATNTAALTGAPLNFEYVLIVTATGTTGTVLVNGRVDAQLGATIGAAITAFLLPAVTSGAVNLASNPSLAMTIAASAAIPSATLVSLTVELVA